MGRENKSGAGPDGFFIGVDLGQTTLSFAAGPIGARGAVEIVRAGSRRHFGQPLTEFARLYREFDPWSILGLAATGLYGEGLAAPVVSGIPEEVAQEYAAEKFFPEAGPINVIRLGGGRGYSILTRDRAGRFNYEENDKCSAGTGESIENICARMGLTLDQAVALASAAEKAIPISARCSVFAKTELTHFANQGEPHDRLLLGYFQSVAQNLFSLFAKNRVDGSVVLIGNGARISPIRAALETLIGAPLLAAPVEAFEACGALFCAFGTGPIAPREWPADPATLIRTRARRIQGFKSEEATAARVIPLPEETPAISAGAPAVLGLDLGSTGSKAALLDLATGALITELYRSTDGNPVAAAKALISELIGKSIPPVAALGLTGSGRSAAAAVFKAAYPEAVDRMLVENEIVAHAAAALQLDPDQGRSLSIVEIGGQDAKFINLQAGRDRRGRKTSPTTKIYPKREGRKTRLGTLQRPPGNRGKKTSSPLTLVFLSRERANSLHDFLRVENSRQKNLMISRQTNTKEYLIVPSHFMGVSRGN